jgi:hypothetical protein
MGIDFGALPPEVTSAQIHAGPGSSSMTAARPRRGIVGRAIDAVAPHHRR